MGLIKRMGAVILRPFFLQPVCKPDSVRFSFLQEKIKPVSIIYLVLSLLAGSYDLPPGDGRAILNAGIHDLSTHEVYGFLCHQRNR